MPAEDHALHLAIIMDGNGRWATERGLPRVFGHQAGIKVLRNIIRFCPEVGVHYLSVYAFSTENWQRPPDEVRQLMDLVSFYLEKERETLVKKGVRVSVIGDRSRLDISLIRSIEKLEALTRNNDRLVLQIALSYGGRNEILEATRKIIQQDRQRPWKDEELTEDFFGEFLFTKGIPDPHLLIRTGGEIRLSNYFLWQLCYSELFFTKEKWPDFTEDRLKEIVTRFHKERNRRFGNVLDA